MDAISKSSHDGMKTSPQAGFSLIEIMVSIVIIALGLLGLAGLQARATVTEFESYQRSQALILLNDMVDRINANRGSAGCYAITTDSAAGTPFLGATAASGHAGATPSCAAGFKDASGKARSEADLAAWNTALQGAGEIKGGAAVGALLGGRGCISYNATTKAYTVTVVWQGNADTFARTDNLCATGLFGSETKRRLVSSTFMIANLGG